MTPKKNKTQANKITTLLLKENWTENMLILNINVFFLSVICNRIRHNCCCFVPSWSCAHNVPFNTFYMRYFLHMIIFCNFHLNLNHFQIVCHKATSQENVMGFQIQIWLPVMKQDIISYMSTVVEDIRTKSMFIMHFGRHNNWIGK